MQEAQNRKYNNCDKKQHRSTKHFLKGDIQSNFEHFWCAESINNIHFAPLALVFLFQADISYLKTVMIELSHCKCKKKRNVHLKLKPKHCVK